MSEWSDYPSYMQDDAFKHHCIGTQYKFTLFPKKCYITGKLIWLKFAYKQTAMYTGPGDTVFENRWYDRNEFLVAKVKGVM